MKISDINPMPGYYDRYIKLVADVELSEAFDQSIRQLDEVDRSLLTTLDGRTYAPGKWAAKDIIQHLADVERIMAYRTLLFARGDRTIPQGFDPDLLVANARASAKTVDELIEDLKTVRAATKSLFGSFDDETLLKTGTNWKYEISVLAMGFTLVGHQIHHLKIIEEKYRPLIG
jgi:DinB superfamily